MAAPTGARSQWSLCEKRPFASSGVVSVPCCSVCRCATYVSFRAMHAIAESGGGVASGAALGKKPKAQAIEGHTLKSWRALPWC